MHTTLKYGIRVILVVLLGDQIRTYGRGDQIQ